MIIINRNKSKLLTPTMWSLYDQSVVSGSNFVVMLFMARTLGAEKFGLVALANTTLLFLNNHQRAYFTQPMNVLGANESVERKSSRLGALLALTTFWVFFGIILIVAVGFFYFKDFRLIASVCFSFVTYQVQEMLRRAWYTDEQPAKCLVNDVVSYIGQIIVLLLLFNFGQLTPLTAFLGMGATSLLALFIAPFQGLHLKWVSFAEAKSVAAEHWGYGRWLVYGVFVVWGTSQLYPFMLSGVGLAAVGAFAACRNLLNGIGVILQAINNYSPTRAQNIVKENGMAGFAMYFSNLEKKLLLVAGGFCGGVALFAPALLTIAYGDSYAGAVWPLRVLAVGTFFTSLTAIPNNALIALGKTRELFLANFISTAFSLTIGWWLVSEAGILGAAYAVSAALGITWIIQSSSMRRALCHSALVAHG